MKSPFRDDKPARIVKPLQSAPTDGLPPPAHGQDVSGKYVASSPNENESHATGPPRSSFPAMFGDMHNQNANAKASTTSDSEAPLPPGIVLGPDGKPCKVCSIGSSFKRYAKMQQKQQQQHDGGAAAGQRRELHTAPERKDTVGMRSEGAKGAAAATAATATTLVVGETSPTEDTATTSSSECPLDVESLGRATWSYLHTMAAYYPTSPSADDQSLMRSHIQGLARFYPCSHCASDFQTKLKEHPVDVSGMEGLSRWLCERHNEVNEKLGKERFDCERVMERWRDGWRDGRCD